MAVNRIAKFLTWRKNLQGCDGASLMAATKTKAKPEPVVNEAVAALIVKAIEERWDGLDHELAAAARISTSGLTQLKTKGAVSLTVNLRKLARHLGFDGKKILNGQLVFVAKPTADRRPDLHAMLNRLIGTPDEATVARLLQGLVDSGKH